MAQVEDYKCYRIQHEPILWRAGEVHRFGNTLNNLTRDWRGTSSAIYDSQGNSAFVNDTLARFYNTIIACKLSDAQVRELWTQLPALLKRTLDALNDSLMAVRELNFEDVRQRQCPELPSRLTCIFLIPDEQSAVGFWWNTLKTQGHSERHIYECRVSGNIHRVSQERLTLKTCSVDRWREIAAQYWSEQGESNEDDEVLFSGDLSVIAEVSPSTFGLS